MAKGLVVNRETVNCSTDSATLSFSMGMGKDIIVAPIGKTTVTSVPL